MVRRLIAVVGVLSLALMQLPMLVANLSASSMPSCCDGIMCPMHHMVDGHVVCDMATMNMDHSGKALQSCPDLAPRYTAALAFVRVAPSIFFAERTISPAPVLASDTALDADRGVALPPPRVFLS